MFLLLLSRSELYSYANYSFLTFILLLFVPFLIKLLLHTQMKSIPKTLFDPLINKQIKKKKCLVVCFFLFPCEALNDCA